MKLPASFLLLSLSFWGCGTEVPSADAQPESPAAQPEAITSGAEQANLFHPREAILISFEGETHFGALMLTDKPGACERFQQGRLARWEKGITFELGKADGYTEDQLEANALPLDAGFYDVVHHDDTSSGPFEDRWSIVFTVERDGACNNTGTLGPAQGGGAYFQSLDLSAGGQGAYYVSFGAPSPQQRFGAFNATPCVIRIQDIPPEYTCE
jgi:hypothetical protein